MVLFSAGADEGGEKKKLTDAEKKEQRTALKDEVCVCICWDLE